MTIFKSEGLSSARWDWRAHLTAKEAAILAAADEAKVRWLELNKERASVTNRAIQRAKYRAKAAQ